MRALEGYKILAQFFSWGTWSAPPGEPYARGERKETVSRGGIEVLKYRSGRKRELTYINSLKGRTGGRGKREDTASFTISRKDDMETGRARRNNRKENKKIYSIQRAV